MAQSHPTSQPDRGETNPRGGWRPSRGFRVGMAGVFAFAVILAAAGAIGAAREPEPFAAEPTAPPPVEITVIPQKTTPPDDVTGDLRGRVSGGRFSVEADDAIAGAVAAATSKSPVTMSSSWSMPPLNGSTAASGVSQSPEQATSSAMVAALAR